MPNSRESELIEVAIEPTERSLKDSEKVEFEDIMTANFVIEMPRYTDERKEQETEKAILRESQKEGLEGVSQSLFQEGMQCLRKERKKLTQSDFVSKVKEGVSTRTNRVLDSDLKEMTEEPSMPAESKKLKDMTPVTGKEVVKRHGESTGDTCNQKGRRRREDHRASEDYDSSGEWGKKYADLLGEIDQMKLKISAFK